MKRYLDPLLSVLRNLLLLMVIYTLCRLVFFAENRSLFPEVDGALLGRLLRGGWRFDISALMYTNALYILLALLPLKIRASKGWQTLVKTLFVVPNFLIPTVGRPSPSSGSSAETTLAGFSCMRWSPIGTWSCWA